MGLRKALEELYERMLSGSEEGYFLDLHEILEANPEAKELTEEFLPDNPGDSAPYFYYVTESESDARENLFDGGKLMHRFVTKWEEVK